MSDENLGEQGWVDGGRDMKSAEEEQNARVDEEYFRKKSKKASGIKVMDKYGEHFKKIGVGVEGLITDDDIAEEAARYAGAMREAGHTVDTDPASDPALPWLEASARVLPPPKWKSSDGRIVLSRDPEGETKE